MARKRLDIGTSYCRWNIIGYAPEPETTRIYQVECPRCKEVMFRSRSEMEKCSGCEACKPRVKWWRTRPKSI
jgi:hypothetical protein